MAPLSSLVRLKNLLLFILIFFGRSNYAYILAILSLLLHFEPRKTQLFLLINPVPPLFLLDVLLIPNILCEVVIHPVRSGASYYEIFALCLGYKFQTPFFFQTNPFKPLSSPVQLII